MRSEIKIAVIAIFMIATSVVIKGQTVTRDLALSSGQTIEIVNRYGRVEVVAQDPAANAVDPVEDHGDALPKIDNVPAAGTLSIISKDELLESEVVVQSSKGNYLIEVKPTSLSKRIDLKLSVPERTKLDISTRDGIIIVDGNFESVNATSDTGTIAADVPLDDLRYELYWTTSKPRFLADFDLEDIKERSGGRFQIKGRYPSQQKGRNPKAETPALANVPDRNETDPLVGNTPPTSIKTEKPKKKNKKSRSLNPKTVSLNFTTARGIVLLNVPPNEVTSDLRERPLTEAAKAIVRSGDADLVEAIRRSSPKYFGDFAKTLPPARSLPFLSTIVKPTDIAQENLKTATLRVLDTHNRAIGDLKPEDFEITESGETRKIVSVKPVSAPVNLVLLLDVSGSIDEYVNFIRKAARNFVNTVGRNDRVSIVLFNEDVKVLSGFTSDKVMLSESLDTFDAGGGTAYYDAIGYTLTETLRPLKGDRTAIVILTDGDDNRSFIPFDALMGSIEESGALIYPLYVPTSLAAQGATQDLNGATDPLRQRYLNVSLTSKAEDEGARLARASGGVYYPITQLSQIQKAYEDIAQQLRSGYDITFRSKIVEAPSGTGVVNNRPSSRLKIHVARPDTYVQIDSVRH